MTLRTSPLAVFAALAALGATGCGGDHGSAVRRGPDQGAGTGAATRPAPATSSTAIQGTAPPSGAGTVTGGDSGGSEPVRVPATFIFTAVGRVQPATVTIPAFIAVELTLASRDGRAHALVLDAGGRRYRLAVPAGGRKSIRIPGLRAGTYPLRPQGPGPGAKLVVGGEVGP